MKILITSETFLPELGGAEIHLINLIKNLDIQGVNVTLFTNEAGESEFDKKYNVIRKAWSKKSAWLIFKILWKEAKKADLIHAHYSYRLALMAGIIAFLQRKPFFITLHGMGTLPRPHSKLIYRIADNIYRSYSLHLASKVISTSDDLAQVAFKYINKNKIKIISNGVDISIFNDRVVATDELLNRYKDKQVIMTVRRLVEKNGLHFLVEAMPYIIEKIPNIKYVMIGDGRMREYLQKRINELGINKYVDLLGKIDNHQIPQYLKIADVIVFPSTAESSSLACVEAMAMGNAMIVASNVGGLVELLSKDQSRGKLVKLVNWHGSNYDAPLQLARDRYIALANVIVDCIKEKKYDIINNAKKYAENNLSWKVITRKTIEVYKQFLK